MANAEKVGGGHQSSHFPYLPDETLVEILLRLPVKSLLRFRSVSKPWRNLISSHNFAKTHTHLSVKNVDLHHLLLVDDDKPMSNLKSCPISSVLDEPAAVVLKQPVELSHDSIRIVGSCNGLVCAITEDYLHLWNPSTGELKNVLLMDAVIYYDFEDIFGFGYDDLNDDYKVVGLFMSDDDCSYGVCVYSLKAGSWRSIPDIDDHVDFQDRGVFVHVNGALYGVANPCDFEEGREFVFSIDLRSETYKKLALPSYKEGKCYNWSVGALGGSLSMSCKYGSHFDVWVMKDNSVGECWMKMVRIPCYTDVRMVPLCILKNGWISLDAPDGGLQVYNPEADTLQDCDIDNICLANPGSSCAFAYTYCESLVSPKTELEQRARLATLEELQD